MVEKSMTKYCKCDEVAMTLQKQEEDEALGQDVT